MEDYTKMDGEKENEEATKKYNYDSEQKEFHDDNELQKGSLATMKVNGASEEWEERQKMAIEGDATMGNAKEGDVANVVSADDAGSLGPEGDKETYKNAQTFKKKSKEAVKGQESRLGTSTKSDSADKYLQENKKENKKEKMKRLIFKKEFNGVENALKMIPESYKVDNKEFHMTDGNEKYEIRWEGSLNEGRAIILKASDKNLMSENMDKMKHLMGYNSQDTLGNLKGAERINENNSFNDVWGKTKSILSETMSVSNGDDEADSYEAITRAILGYGEGIDYPQLTPEEIIKVAINYARNPQIDVHSEKLARVVANILKGRN